MTFIPGDTSRKLRTGACSIARSLVARTVRKRQAGLAWLIIGLAALLAVRVRMDADGGQSPAGQPQGPQRTRRRTRSIEPVPTVPPSQPSAPPSEPSAPTSQSSAAPAQPSVPTAQPAGSGSSGVGFRLENADLLQFISLVAARLKINYVVDPSVKGTVTINTAGDLRTEDLLPILETVLRINGATAVQTGNFR